MDKQSPSPGVRGRHSGTGLDLPARLRLVLSARGTGRRAVSAVLVFHFTFRGPSNATLSFATKSRRKVSGGSRLSGSFSYAAGADVGPAGI